MNNKPMDTIAGKTLLLVNTGSIKKKFILKRLKKLGLNLICLNKKEESWASSYVDRWVLTDNSNHSQALEDLEGFLSANQLIKIDGVLTFWEDDVLLTSKISDKLNLTGIPFKIAKIARNKFLFRKFCQENNIKTPQYLLIKSKKDIDNVCQNFHFPLVIKPIYGSSSAYVVKINTKEEFLSTYSYVKNNLSVNVESALADGLDIMVEEYIDGEEVDIDIALQNGKVKFYSISDNFQTKEPFFVETGQAIPSSLPLSKKKELIVLAEEVLEKIGVQNGVIHFEAKSTTSGPVPIEVNLRMGGDEVHSFVYGAWGVDLIEYAARIAFDSYIPLIDLSAAVPKKYITGAYFLSDYSGVLSKLEIDEVIEKKEFLEEMHFFKKIGDPVLAPPEGFEYLGWVTTSGVNALDAEDNLEEILKLVQYEVAKFDRGSSMGKTSRKSRFSSAVLNKNLLMQAAKIRKVRKIISDNQKNFSIGILGNFFANDDSVELHKNVNLAEQIKKTLMEKGYNEPRFFDFNNYSQVINELKESSIDLVFNICGKMNNLNLSEFHAAAMLEILQIPYTGSDPTALSLCMDKIKVKKLLDYHKIPTPKWDYAYSVDDEISDTLKYPLIVKPGNANSSIGVTNGSVVSTKKQLDEQLEKIISKLGLPALVEEYIEGDEYNVSIIGSNEEDLQVLPLLRSIFRDLPENYWHIFSYEAKWSGLPVYEKIIHQYPAEGLSKKLESLITEISLDAYLILGCRDYGVVDIRVDEHNNPYILEVNPNSPLNQNAFLPAIAGLLGMEKGSFLEETIWSVIERYSRKSNI